MQVRRKNNNNCEITHIKKEEMQKKSAPKCVVLLFFIKNFG